MSMTKVIHIVSDGVESTEKMLLEVDLEHWESANQLILQEDEIELQVVLDLVRLQDVKITPQIMIRALKLARLAKAEKGETGPDGVSFEIALRRPETLN